MNVWYGANGDKFGVAPGSNLREVLAQPDIRDTCGYTNLSDQNTVVVVEGKEIPREQWDKTIIKSGQTVEVIKRAGQKASYTLTI